MSTPLPSFWPLISKTAKDSKRPVLLMLYAASLPRRVKLPSFIVVPLLLKVVASVKVLAPLDCKVPVLLMVSALMLLAPPAAVAKVRVPLLLRVLASCIVLPSAPPCKVPALVRPVAWIFKPLPKAFAPAWLSKEAVPVLLKLSVPPACKYALILLMTATLLPVA